MLDIAASTMANIAPAMSFFFSFALIAAAAGVASPLTIVLAAIAIALLGNTLAQFSRAIPSTGSFVTFIGKTFGPVVAITTAVVIGAGYIIAIASVATISGGWTQIIIRNYTPINIPWQLLTLVFTLGALYLMISGVKLSTKWAGVFFAFELLLLVVVAVALLVEHASSLSAAPFNPSHLSKGAAGLALGFPIAIYMFIGWENSASLAEETSDPRRNVGKAIFSSILLMTATYLLLAYATVVGFDLNAKGLSSASVPFIAAAKSVLGVFVFLAYLAGFTSTLGALISASNSQARIIFNSAREGLLPAWIAKVSERHRTPWASFVVFLGLTLGIVYIFGWRVDPVEFFGEVATLGSILVSLTYLVTNLALPVYYRRYHPEEFHLLKHLVLPALGVIAIAYPLYQLVKPGQPAPFSYFPWISLGVIVAALIYAFILYRRDRTLGERVGSLLADD